MKIVALKEHKCYCCGAITRKGEECFALFFNPSNPNENEFDVIYTCKKCAEEESCKVRIERKSATTQ